MKQLNLSYSLIFILLSSIITIAEQFPERDYLKIVTIFTNDVHGGIDRGEASFINPDFPPTLGGGAVAGRYILEKRQEAKKNGWGFLLLDAGDIYQGTPLGTLSEGEAVIEYMNTVGYDATTIGNHDFDNGWQNLKKLTELAHFPFLSSNLFRKSTGELAEFVKPYIIKEIQGIKIGIIGATLSSTPSMSFPEHIKDLDFRSEVDGISRYLPEIKAQGVNTIILLTHAWLAYDPQAGYQEMLSDLKNGKLPERYNTSAQAIAHRVPGIDIIFSGHLHKGFYDPWEDPLNHTLIFQNYANGSNLGHVNFYIHRKTATLAGYDYATDDGMIFTLFEDDFLPDTSIGNLIDHWVRKAEAGFDVVIGSTTGPVTRSSGGESPMGNLLTDAMLASTRADIAFSNFGGVRSDLPAGPLTPRHVFDVMPFGNRLVVMQVTGGFLRELVEDLVSGNSRGMLVGGAQIVIDRHQPDGSRVIKFNIAGKPIDENQEYTLAVSDYLAEGNSGYDRLTSIPINKINYSGTLLRQTIVDYIKQNSPIIPKTDGRWQELK